MSVARKILGNTVAQILGKVVVAVLGLFTVKLLTNYLTQAGMGQYNQAYDWLAVFAIAADLGLFTIAVKEMSEDGGKIQVIMGNVLSMRTILSVGVMAVAVLIAFINPDYRGTEVPILVSIGAVSTILSILNGTVAALLQVHLKMHWQSMALVAGRLVGFGYLLYVILVAYPNDTLTGLYQIMTAGIITNVVMFAITTYFASKLANIKYRLDLKVWKDVFFKSLPYGLALILNQIYFRIDSLFIFSMRGSVETAIYGVPMKILELFSVVPLYFMNSVLPTLTRRIKEGKEKFNHIIQYSFDFLNMISIPMVVGAYILAYPVIYLMSNDEYLTNLNENFFGSDIALKILVFAMLFSFVNILFAFILISINKQAKLLYINAGMVLFNVVTNLLVIPEWGFRGAAMTTVVTEFLVLILNAWVAWRYVKFTLKFNTLFKIIISSLFMGAAVQFLVESLADTWKAKVVILAVPFGALVYLIMLFLTRAITKDMIRLIFKGRA